MKPPQPSSEMNSNSPSNTHLSYIKLSVKILAYLQKRDLIQQMSTGPFSSAVINATTCTKKKTDKQITLLCLH